MYALFTLPDPAGVFGSIGAWSAPLFSDLLPFAYFAVGVFVGGLLAAFVITSVRRAIGKLFSKDSNEAGERKLTVK